AEFGALGHAPGGLTLDFSVDVRYVGQGYELRVPIDPAEVDRGGVAVLTDRFHALHDQQYGHSFQNAPVEAISFRLVARCPRPAQVIERRARDEAPGGGSRSVALPGASGDYPVLARSTLAPGNRGNGPAILMEPTTSTLVPPGWRYEAMESGAILLSRSSA
ncbi:MAG: hypothetical protein OEU46_10115, partial [Alphaproteobacteria bacterium]|nr:hypothetical protein [Alphaproteobacteria bacterium]